MDEKPSDQARRIRDALRGKAELTVEDAKRLQRGRAGLGWLGRASRGRTALFVGVELFWVLDLVLRAVNDGGRAPVAPVVFVVLGLWALIVTRRRESKIDRALRERQP